MRRIIQWGCAVILLMLICTASFALGRHSVPAQRSASTEVISPIESDVLESFRTERQQLRQMQLSQLNEIIHSNSADTEIVTLAQQKLLELMEWSEQELTLEGILAMRDFEEAVVTVHTDSVNVMVRAESVTQQEASIILELVLRETGISGGNVKVIPIAPEK